MAAVVPQNLAAALRYGPQTQSALRRSQYLTDALKQLGESSQQPIRSPLELGSKLLATALLNHAGKKADAQALSALRADQDTESSSILAALRPPAQTAPEPPPVAAQAPPVPTQAAPIQPPPQTPPAPAQAAYAPQDRDALIRMISTEAIGEGPQGMAAAGHVALNRLKSGKFGASLREVVTAPRQFEGMSRASRVQPQDYAAASQVADAILSGQLPDPTGGAINFLNPELQAQHGRPIPDWAQGQGQRIGRHVFFGGQPGAQQMTQAQVPPPPAPPDPRGPPVQPDAQPFQVAAAGDLQPGMIPSASGRSSPDAGTPPAPPFPQAAGAGGNPIAPEQLALVERLLKDPRTHEVGMAYAMELQKKAAEPTKYDIKVQDAHLIATDPAHPDRRVVQSLPELQARPLSDAEAAQYHQPPGTVVQQQADGKLLFQRPDGGQMVVSQPGQPYREAPVPGGQNDPYRPQAPAQSYQYTGPGAQSAIPGSPADLKNPANVMEGANRYGGMVKTIVDSAMKVKQNFGAVTTGYRQRNGTGDIAMVNGIQKLIDDGVVKGEDVNMQMKSNGLQGTLGGWAQYANSGGLFTDDVRQKVFKTAQDLYHNLDGTYRVRVTSLQPGFDEAYGPGSFGKYVFPQAFAEELGWTGGGAAPAAHEQSIPPAAAARHADLRKLGKIDPSKPYGDPLNPVIAKDDATLKAMDRPENRGKWVITPAGDLARID